MPRKSSHKGSRKHKKSSAKGKEKEEPLERTLGSIQSRSSPDVTQRSHEGRVQKLPKETLNDWSNEYVLYHVRFIHECAYGDHDHVHRLNCQSIAIHQYHPLFEIG